VKCRANTAAEDRLAGRRKPAGAACSADPPRAITGGAPWPSHRYGSPGESLPLATAATLSTLSTLSTLRSRHSDNTVAGTRLRGRTAAAGHFRGA
jgi:hypothetical protein